MFKREIYIYLQFIYFLNSKMKSKWTLCTIFKISILININWLYHHFSEWINKRQISRSTWTPRLSVVSSTSEANLVDKAKPPSALILSGVLIVIISIFGVKSVAIVMRMQPIDQRSSHALTNLELIFFTFGIDQNRIVFDKLHIAFCVPQLDSKSHFPPKRH